MSWQQLQNILVLDSDPITDFFNHDWAAVGGWSLFLGLALFNVIGIYRGWVIPGWMYKDQGKTLNKAMEQNQSLLAAADITKHFFETQTRKPRVRKPAEVKTHDPETESTGTII